MVTVDTKTLQACFRIKRTVNWGVEYVWQRNGGQLWSRAQRERSAMWHSTPPSQPLPNVVSASWTPVTVLFLRQRWFSVFTCFLHSAVHLCYSNKHLMISLRGGLLYIPRIFVNICVFLHICSSTAFSQHSSCLNLPDDTNLPQFTPRITALTWRD